MLRTGRIVTDEMKEMGRLPSPVKPFPRPQCRCRNRSSGDRIELRVGDVGVDAFELGDYRGGVALPAQLGHQYRGEVEEFQVQGLRFGGDFPQRRGLSPAI